MQTVALPPFRTTDSWFRTNGAFWPSHTYSSQHSVYRFTVQELHRDPDKTMAGPVRVDPHEPLRIALEEDLPRAQSGQPVDVTGRDELVACRLARLHLDSD
jgi:hypothetical protein